MKKQNANTRKEQKLKEINKGEKMKKIVILIAMITMFGFASNLIADTAMYQCLYTLDQLIQNPEINAIDVYCYDDIDDETGGQVNWNDAIWDGFSEDFTISGDVTLHMDDITTGEEAGDNIFRIAVHQVYTDYTTHFPTGTEVYFSYAYDVSRLIYAKPPSAGGPGGWVVNFAGEILKDGAKPWVINSGDIRVIDAGQVIQLRIACTEELNQAFHPDDNDDIHDLFQFQDGPWDTAVYSWAGWDIQTGIPGVSVALFNVVTSIPETTPTPELRHDLWNQPISVVNCGIRDNTDQGNFAYITPMESPHVVEIEYLPRQVVTECMYYDQEDFIIKIKFSMIMNTSIAPVDYLDPLYAWDVLDDPYFHGYWDTDDKTYCFYYDVLEDIILDDFWDTMKNITITITDAEAYNGAIMTQFEHHFYIYEVQAEEVKITTDPDPIVQNEFFDIEVEAIHNVTQVDYYWLGRGVCVNPTEEDLRDCDYVGRIESCSNYPDDVTLFCQSNLWWGYGVYRNNMAYINTVSAEDLVINVWDVEGYVQDYGYVPGYTFSSYSDPIEIIPPTITPPTNTVAYDVDDNCIGIDYTLSLNDPFYSSFVSGERAPIDYYVVQRDSFNINAAGTYWQTMAFIAPHGNNGDDTSVILVAPISIDEHEYQMAAVFDPENTMFDGTDEIVLYPEDVGAKASGVYSPWADCGHTANPPLGVEEPSYTNSPKLNIANNPFRESTTISFSLGNQQSPVELTVFNIKGQKVATLISENINSSNNYEIEFNAEHLSSGIYFAKLQLDEKILTKKMILIK